MRNEYKAYLGETTVPEGMAWPMFEDGEPVRIGDSTEDAAKVCRISFTKRGFYFNSSHRKGLRRYRYGERVGRPASEMLDADGVECKVGDTVWARMGSGYREFVVADRGFGECGPWLDLDSPDGGRSYGMGNEDPSVVTHRRPVLASDGRRLVADETVWHEDGGEWLVEEVNEYGACCFDGDRRRTLDPSKLTHERPRGSERVMDKTMPIVGCEMCYREGEVLPHELIVSFDDGCVACQERYALERTCHPINPERVSRCGVLHMMFHRCSECGRDLPYEAEKGHCNYCPECGARVVEP